jgi:hypothetical protein
MPVIALVGSVVVVVVPVVIVIVIRMALMGMTVTIMVMVIVAVAVMIVVVMIGLASRPGGVDIGAAYRIERRLERDGPSAEAANHRLDHAVAADAKALGEEFGRQMAVAEMPGETRQDGRVGGADFGQRLRRRDDFDDAPVVEPQAVAGAQHRRFLEIEQERQAAHAGHREATAIALVEVENDRIGRLAGPGPGRCDGAGAQHDASNGEQSSI